MDSRPIGLFDSGVGGVCVLSDVKKQLPNENYIYLGDTKGFPYGGKSRETIINLTRKGIDFLISKNVKVIIIACGTATSQALEIVKDEYNVPIIGIIEPTIDYLKSKGSCNNIGIMATSGTIKSNSWQRKIKKSFPNAHIEAVSCPVLAPLAEEGWIENNVAKYAIKEYISKFKNVDSIILGCTHYPLFKKVLQEQLPEGTELINTGEKIATFLKQKLLRENMEVSGKETQKDLLYFTDIEGSFVQVAENLLKENLERQNNESRIRILS